MSAVLHPLVQCHGALMKSSLDLAEHQLCCLQTSLVNLHELRMTRSTQVVG